MKMTIFNNEKNYYLKIKRELTRKHHGEIEKMNKVQFFIN